MTDRLLGLLIEFDEMGFSPTTVCEEPEGYAIKWKELLLEEIKALESDNVSLRNEADENAALSMESKMRADRLEVENAALRERLENAVELPRTEVSPYDSNDTLLYYIAAGHIQQECFNNKFPEQLQIRLAELKGE